MKIGPHGYEHGEWTTSDLTSYRGQRHGYSRSQRLAVQIKGYRAGKYTCHDENGFEFRLHRSEMKKPKNEIKGIEEMNEVPTIHSEGLTVERLNSLLDKLTSKPYASAALATQSVRAALDLHGITLPPLEVEGGSGGNYGSSVADGPSILHGVHGGTDPKMYSPPAEGEWLFKVKDSDGPDDDFDDHLYLYVVMDHIIMPEIGNAVDCYAQIISDEDVEDIAAMKDDDYQDAVGAGNSAEHEGDRSGESEYQKQVRHIGGLIQEK
jgi:hypothetical protein